MGISSMNATINNNRKLLKNGKREPFTKMNGGSKRKPTYRPYVIPEVPPHVLRRIRRKVKHENRQMMIKQITIGIVVGAIIFYYVFI